MVPQAPENSTGAAAIQLAVLLADMQAAPVAPHCRLLRACQERPNCHCPAIQRDKFSSSHALLRRTRLHNLLKLSTVLREG